MLFKTLFLSASILGLLPLSGCFLRANTVIEKFSGEFRCAKDQVTVAPQDKNLPDMYKVSGCNRRANYRCSGDYGEFCERLGQPETINPEGMIDGQPAAGSGNPAPAPAVAPAVPAP
jgi:hypothetical protein